METYRRRRASGLRLSRRRIGWQLAEGVEDAPEEEQRCEEEARSRVRESCR
jgi:hypothetical protein